MGVILAVTTGKGGVGKSSVSAGLGFAFCKMAKKVLLVDMDEGLRCLDLMLGVDKQTIFDLSDALSTERIEDSIYPDEKHNGLYLMPAPSKVGLVETERFSSFANRVSNMFDVVIFDFPAGIDLPLYKALPENTKFLTVAVLDLVSIRDASAIGNELYESGISSRLILNRFVYKQSKKFKMRNIDEIIDMAGLRLIGIVPESQEITLLSLNHSLSEKGKPMAALMRIARRINGEPIGLPKLKRI